MQLKKIFRGIILALIFLNGKVNLNTHLNSLYGSLAQILLIKRNWDWEVSMCLAVFKTRYELVNRLFQLFISRLVIRFYEVLTN